MILCFAGAIYDSIRLDPYLIVGKRLESVSSVQRIMSKTNSLSIPLQLEYKIYTTSLSGLESAMPVPPASWESHEYANPIACGFLCLMVDRVVCR